MAWAEDRSCRMTGLNRLAQLEPRNGSEWTCYHGIHRSMRGSGSVLHEHAAIAAEAWEDFTYAAYSKMHLLSKADVFGCGGITVLICVADRL